MKFGRIRLRGFKSYVDETLDLSRFPAVCITGDMGSGKSTLWVDAPLWAMFGAAHADLDEVIGHGVNDARVDLELIDGDKTYLISRSRKRGSTSALSVKLSGPEGLTPLVTGVLPAQEYINNVLLNGRGYSEFVSSVYMVQGKHGEFTGATQAKAKSLFMSLQALDVWKGRATYVSKKRLALEKGNEKLHSRVGFLRDTVVVVDEAEIDRLKTQLAQIHEENESFVKDSEESGKALKQNDAVRSERGRAQATLVSARAHVNALMAKAQVSSDGIALLKEETAGYDLQTLDEALDKFETDRLVELKWRTEEERARSVVSAASREVAQLESSLKKSTDELAELSEAEQPICDKCHQVLNEKHLQVVSLGLQKEIESLEFQLRNTSANLASLEAAAAEVSDAKPEYSEEKHLAAKSLKSTAQTLDRACAQHTQLGEGIEEAELSAVAAERSYEECPEPFDDTEPQENLRRLDLLLRKNREYESDYRSKLAVLENDKLRYDNGCTELEQLEHELVASDLEYDRLTLAERMFKDDGIPSYLMQVSIPEVEDSANELLDQMTGGRMSLSVETERLTKTAGVKDALDIIMTDEWGDKRSFRTLSGGEGFCVNFALRVALAKLVERRSGLDLSMLVIDEPEGLDDKGREAFVTALAVVSARFESISLISHDPYLGSSLQQNVVVSRTSGTSHIAVSE